VKSLLRRRPSPAMIVALIALFVSLSGVSYGVATGFIDSREIKNNEVRSRDVRNNEIRTRDLRNNEVRGIDIRNSTVQGRDVGLNTLTGNDVNEATLGKVPSAAAADTAGTAGTAGTANSATTAGSIGGVTLHKVDYVGQMGSGFVEILDVGGLTLEARCQNAGTPALEVRANTTAADSEIRSDFGAFTNNDTDFNPGDNAIVYDSTADAVGSARYGGADGRVVTLDAYALNELDGVRGTSNDCGFWGVAQAG
jgi:hypothetical protein